ncbi:MAG: cellulase family glycosylhydrolase [Calothrix sp. C42_A2020_038]|nr:cellulase family glycosylhydrolase [Calothrix sp. C42_A2020_038]
MAIKTPLSTNGSQIVDANGNTVLLRGVNWFGIETDVHVPHGLWKRDYKDILRQIKSLKYNIIRLSYSVQALRSSDISAVDFSIGANRDLQGKTPLQVMDIIIQEAARNELLIMLDSHRLNDSTIPELWYGDGYTEADWIETWKLLANRYKTVANVVAADLKNEPHGRASWGTGDLTTDWRLAAERCGNAILAINPNWLIVVEGVEKNVANQQLAGHWWGGNLEGVRNYPVRLKVANKLVYSPHEYGQGVADQPWFSELTFPQNLYTRWEKGFYYIAANGIAPVLIGEFGGRQVDKESKEGIWQRQLVDYIKQKDLSFTYWSWNPNSSDTGGILLDDWLNIHIEKQELLATLLTAQVPTPIPTPTPAPTPTPVPTPGTTQLVVEVVIQADWNAGFCINFRVTNKGTVASKNWKLNFAINEAKILQTWNASYISKNSIYEATPVDWAKVIQPGKTVEIGYCADKLGANYKPTQISVSLV